MTMAKNNSDGSLGCLFIFALLIILPLVPIAWGIYALVKWFKWSKLKKRYPNNSVSNFWITNEEKIKYLDLLKDYTIVNVKLNQADDNLNRLRETADAENVSRNVDGSISNRSNRGKELNRLFNEYDKIYNSFSNQRQRIRTEISYLCEKPVDEWFHLKGTFSPYYSSTSAFIGWFIAFYGSLSYFFKKPLLAIFEIYDHFALGRNEFIVLKDNWTMKLIFALLISAIISIGIYYLTKYLADKFVFEKKYAKPPIVNRDNYDNY